MNSSINCDKTEWHRYIKDTNTTERISNVGVDDFNITSTSSFTMLSINNTVKSHTGYYWVRVPTGNFCNVSLTVESSKYLHL